MNTKYGKVTQYMKSFKAIILICIILFIVPKKKKNIILHKKVYSENSYFTTWATSLYQISPPSFKLNQNTIRQTVRVTVGGKKIRLKVSNQFGKSNLEIKGVSISDIIENSEIDKRTIKYLTFKGKGGITLKAGEESYSDTIPYQLNTRSQIAITMYFGSVPKQISGHILGRPYTYCNKKNKLGLRKFEESEKDVHWYFISAIEVSSKIDKKTVVCFGDSITDGVTKYKDSRYNYPDFLHEKFNKMLKTSNIAVVNAGISGDKITIKGLERFQHDVLNIKGISHIIVLYGVNDINFSNRSAKKVISAYKKIITLSHEKNIPIYAGTIMPFSSYNGYGVKPVWNKNKEKQRKKVNRWIRETKPENGGFDAFFDFDYLVKDEKNETKFNKDYDCGDGLHPSEKGYRRMVEGINNTDLFTN